MYEQQGKQECRHVTKYALRKVFNTVSFHIYLGNVTYDEKNNGISYFQEVWERSN